MKEFSESLARLIRDKKMSQADLSRASGVQASAISTYVNDTSEPSLSNARRIADALGVTLDQMVGLEQLPNQNNILSPDELNLVRCYRVSTSQWKKNILMTAQAAAAESKEASESDHDAAAGF